MYNGMRLHFVKRDCLNGMESGMRFPPSRSYDEVSQNDFLTLHVGGCYLDVPIWPHTGLNSQRRE